MHTFLQKKRISFSVGSVSQLLLLQQETNVSSVVFPVQHCQILFQLSQKYIWSHANISSALATAEAPPMAPPTSPNLSPGWGLGLIILWVKCLVSHNSPCPKPQHLPFLGPVLQGVQQSSLLHIGDLFSISREQRISPALFSVFSVLNSTLFPVSMYCVLWLHLSWLHLSWLHPENPREHFLTTCFPPWNCLCSTLISSPYFFLTLPRLLILK